MRKRDCKHIRLVLKSLNVDDEPDKWKGATASLVEQQAAALTLDVKEEEKGREYTGAECTPGSDKISGIKEEKVSDEPPSKI